MNRLVISLCSIVCLVFLTATSPVFAEDWPTYRHDATRAGATGETLAWPLTSQWIYRTPVPLRTAWSGAEGRSVEGKDLHDRVRFDDALHVAVVKGRVYFGSSVDHRVHCVDAATGRTVWTAFTDAPIRLAPTVAEGRVYIGSEDGYAWCLDATTGRVLWRLRLGPADERIVARGEMISRWPVRTGILVEGGVAYFGAGIFPHENVYLSAVDAKTGKPIWRNDQVSHGNAGRADLSPQGYLLATKAALYFPSGRSRPSAVNRKTGKIQVIAGWRGGSAGETLTLSSGQVAGANAVILDGALRTFTLGSQVGGSNGSTYVTTGETLARINQKVYSTVNSNRAKLRNDLRAVYSEYRSGKIEKEAYLVKAEAVRAKLNSQEEVGVEWKVKCASNAAVIVTATQVVVGGEDTVEIFDAKTGKSTGRLAVQGAARGLAISDGRLMVSTDTGRIHCFSVGPAGKEIAAGKPVADPYPRDKWTDVYEASAKSILARTGIDSGFCLVVGAEQGRLALALARNSGLKIYGVESDPAKVAAARKALVRTGLYGHRITIHEAAAGEIPYSNYFANLVVSDTHLLTGRVPVAGEVVAAHLKPCGGAICLGGTHAFDDAWRNSLGLSKQSVTKTSKKFTVVERGKLPGAGSWSHQYGDAGNTACSDDQLIRGGLGVLWFGDPGPGKMVNRHDGAVGPVSTNGRMFIQGTDSLMAYDAYNGQFLWEFKNSKAIRTGVFQNHAPGNLVASDDSVFMMLDSRCLQLDAATGKLQATHLLPTNKSVKEHEWGYVALLDGMLIGTGTRRKRLDAARARRGKQTTDATDAIFAIDLKTGKHLWSYQGKSIDFRTIALGPGRVHFIDSTITAEQRLALLNQDKTELQNLKGEERQRGRGSAKTDRRSHRHGSRCQDRQGTLAAAGRRDRHQRYRHRWWPVDNGVQGWRAAAGRCQRQRSLLEAVHFRGVQEASPGGALVGQRLQAVVQGRQLPASSDRCWQSDYCRAVVVRTEDRQTDHADSSVDRPGGSVELHEAGASLRDEHRHAKHAVLPFRFHRVLRLAVRQWHAAFCRTPPGLLDQRDSRQRAGDDSRGECRVRVPVLDCLDHRDGTSSPATTVGHLQWHWYGDASQEAGTEPGSSRGSPRCHRKALAQLSTSKVSQDDRPGIEPGSW